MKKSITFSVPIEKEVKRIGKKWRKNSKILTYRLKCIDSARFMASPLSNLVNNLAEGIDKTKGKYGHNNKNCKTSGIKYKDFECCFELQNR